MFVLSVLEAPNTKTNSLCVQTHLAIKLFLILILLLQFADFCKIASVFAFQIKEWFQFNMLQAHLLVINN